MRRTMRPICARTAGSFLFRAMAHLLPQTGTMRALAGSRTSVRGAGENRVVAPRRDGKDPHRSPEVAMELALPSPQLFANGFPRNGKDPFAGKDLPRASPPERRRSAYRPCPEI